VTLATPNGRRRPSPSKPLGLLGRPILLLPSQRLRDMAWAMRVRVLGFPSALFFAVALATSWTTTALAAPPNSGGIAKGAGNDDPNGRDPAVAAIEQWVLGVSQTTLENGLRVVLAPDPESPTVSVCVTYDVGSRNEILGQSGFAHLFEHMMFQGSRNVGKGAHFQLVTGRGGQLNGTTSTDRTNYFETLPANELDLGLWLEADRMRWLDVSASNFENQRAVVKEEYRMRVENAAYRPALIELERLIFAGYPPYEHPTIGSMADLDAAKLDWVQDFHARYYAPNNAVLTISGGFDPNQALGRVKKYFAPIPSVKVPAFANPPVPPFRTAEQRTQVDDVNAKTEALMIGWRIPESRNKDHYALEMAAKILADGESSVLYESLVRKRPLARDVSAFTYDHRGPDAFVVTVELNLNARMNEVEQRLDRHLTELAEQGPSDDVLLRAKQRTKSSFVFGLQSNQARAMVLGEYATYFGDPRLIARDLEALLQVTRQDVKVAASRYLSKQSRTIVTVRPTPPPEPAPPVKGDKTASQAPSENR
jgi:zinc protease